MDQDKDAKFANLSFLNSDELSLIPPGICTKVDENFGRLLGEQSTLGINHERQKVDLEEATLQLQTVQERVRILESTESKLSQDNAELRATAAELQQTKLQTDTELHSSESNRQHLAASIERKDQQLSELRDEIANLTAKCNRLTAELTESKVKKLDEDSSYSIIQTQLARKENECLQLIDERNTLDSEKLAYMRQVSRLQMEKSAESSSHHHSVETIKADLSNTEQLLETYKNQCESVTERLRQEQARHRECRDNFISAEESHRQELSSQKKLAAMYKEAEQKAAAELQDLHKTAADYKECFEQLTKEHEESMAQTKSQIVELGEIIRSKDDHIGQIEAELARMNELMKESSESPDVTAELAKLIKSGLTYSQLYHKYHQTAEKLTIEKGENTRLNDCLDTLVKEIDVMRPQVSQLRSAHEASSAMVQKLSEQLKLNLQNLDAEARKAGEAQKLSTHYQKETNRYRVENEDLALQVQVLTKEVHIAKGGKVVNDDLSTQVSSSSSRQGSAADVISSQLVSFKDIQELQKHNQQLRLALREMSEEQEKNEKSDQNSEKTRSLERELGNTRQEIEFLKQSRLKQEELVQSIIKQRDMYKRLVEQGDVKEALAKASPRRAITEVDNEKLKSLNDELRSSKASLEKIQQEFQSFRKEQNVAERNHSDKLEKLKAELTEQRLNNAKLTTQLDYSMEGSKVMEKNVVAYKQEINSLRTKAEQYSNLVAKNESLVASLREDLSKAQESSIKFDVANQQARNEAELLKAANRRLQIEADTARKDYNLQLKMLSNLQSIQTSIESSNVEMKAHYQHRLEQSTNENQTLQKQLDSLKGEMKTTDTHHSAEVANWKSKVESLDQQLAASQEKLLKSIEEQKLHRQSSVGRGREVSVSEQGADGGAAESEQSQDLRHARSEIEALKDQLRLSGEASDEYRTAADRLELTLREQTAAGQQIQETLEAKVTQQQADLDTLAMKIKDMAQQYDTLFEQKANIESEAAQSKSQLHTELNDFKNQLLSHKESLEMRERQGAQAKTDLEQTTKLNEELSSKYQTELENGIKLSEECSSVKRERDQLSGKVSTAENDIIRLELQLQSNHASFEEREKGYKESVESLKEQLNDSKEQTKLLHQQIEYLSVKQGSSFSTSQDTEESGQQSTLKLLELVGVLRKDKELYETKFEGSTAECKRLEAKVAFVEGELKLARDELAGGTTQTAIDIQTKAQHAELLRKVEQINVLTDSNRMLRQEKDGLQPRIDQLQEQVTQLQAAMVPLESKTTELTMSVQSLEGEKVALQKTVEHWKQRSSSLVEKHDRERTEENKRHTAQLEQQKKSTTGLNQQIQRLNAELAKQKSTTSSTEEEKSKLSTKVVELEEKLSSMDTTLNSNKEELAKKENLISELRKLGRKYKLQYTKLSEAKGSAGSDGSAGTSTSSGGLSSGEVSKLETELSTVKESLTAKEEEITKLQAELDQANTQLAEAKAQLEKLQKELSDQTEQHNKVKLDLDEITSKNTTLKDFVNNSLKPKITNQKKELDKKNEELKQLQTKATELETQLDDTQQHLDEARAKLLSLEEKSSGPQASSQSGHITASTDSKRSQVRTIEVRPMAQQQPKQLTATVMPTTSQAEPPEVAFEEPVVGIVSPTSMVASPNSNVPTSNSGASVEVAPVQQQLSQPSSSSAISTSTSAPPASGATSSTATSVFATLHPVAPHTVTTTASTSPSLSTQGVPATIITAQTSAGNAMESGSAIGSVPTSSTSMGGMGDADVAGQSNEAEANRVKRSRDECEGDEESAPPSAKKTKDVTEGGQELSVQEVDDGTSQETNTDEDQMAAEAIDTSEYVTAVSSMQQDMVELGEAGPSAIYSELEPITAGESMSGTGGDSSLGAFTSPPMMSNVGMFEENTEQAEAAPTSAPVQQEPTYSGVDADVVIILSSDDEDAEEDAVQTSHQMGDAGDYSEGESETGDDGEMGEEEYEEVDEGEDGEGSSEEGGEGDESDYNEEAEPEAAEEPYDEDGDTSDIIMIEDEEPANAATNAGMSVSSSQQGASNEGSGTRRLATLAALNYQAQGTVSVDSNINEGDGIVPSTPTLAMPVSRNDGFAVAVSSPNPSMAPFVFGSSSTIPSMEHVDLEQQAIVMDDLPQFGDSEAGTMSEVNEVDGSASLAVPMASNQEQSNVVSTESHYELDSSTSVPAAATTSNQTNRNIMSDEPVSSSEANNEGGRPHVIEPIVWNDNGQSSSSDMPSSSSQSRPPVARRGRLRGARLNRPTFNKPQ